MKVVKVIPLKKGLKKENLSYFTSQDIVLGNIVSVPVRSKIVDGLVVGLEDLTGRKSEVKSSLFRLKKIEKVKGKINMSNAFLRTADKIKDYYASTTAETLSALFPKIFLECQEKLLPGENKEFERSNLKQEKLILQNPTEERVSFYKTFVRESFAKKKSILICLPTYRDIKSFAPLISKGIADYVYIFHNEIGKKNFVKRYNKLAAEEHPALILVSPFYLFLARENLSAIIIEKENSGAYKTLTRPFIDLRLLAEVLSKDINVKIIFADTLVRAETLKRWQDQELTPVLPISFRTRYLNRKELISLEKNEGAEKNKFKALSSELEEKLHEAFRTGERSFLFVLRKGLAPITVCNDCKKPFLCDFCQAPMVLYQSESKKRIYICHRCRHKKDALVKCGSCQSWNLSALGIATDLVYREIEKKWPGRKIFRIDKDNAKSPAQAQKIIEDFYKTPGAILVGTEMALHYLSLPIENTAVVSFDSLFSIPDFQMGEKIIHLLVALGNLAKKSFMIQTRNPKDPTLGYFLSGNLAQFYRDEFENREKFNYPPFTTLIKITFRGSKEAVLKSQAEIEALLKDYNPLIYRSFIPKIKNLYVLNALIKVKKENWSLPEISESGSLDQALLQKLKSLSPAYTIQIDPEDLL